MKTVSCFVFAVLICLVRFPQRVSGASIYVALGDSITFGETNLAYVPSLGDRGYVALLADHLANAAGVRPKVMNFAIDGETASSFRTVIDRKPPVTGRIDPILDAQNAATPFGGQETALTDLDNMPARFLVAPPFGGTLPIGNVHPNALGYAAIAGAAIAVPEPATGMLAVTGLLLLTTAASGYLVSSCTSTSQTQRPSFSKRQSPRRLKA